MTRQFVLLCCLALSPALLRAHRISIFATVESDAIVGQVYAGSGSPLADLPVRLLDTGQVEQATTRSAADGRFRFPLPVPGSYQVVVDAGDGHRATWDLTVGDIGEQAPVGTVGSPVGPQTDGQTAIPDGRGIASLQAGISRLEQRLHALEQRIGLRDLLGAVGYLIGLTGIVFWMMARADRRHGRIATSETPPDAPG